MAIPPDTPEEVVRLLHELFGDEELGGFWFSEDYTRIQARVFIDGVACTQVFEKDPATGHYKLTGYSGLGRAKL